jgi:hypothetical protein
LPGWPAGGQTRHVIKDVVIHLQGRLPLLADLHQVPGPTDLLLRASNVRTRDGKRPTFAEETDSWFLIPVHQVTVIELPQSALDGLASTGARLGHPADAGPLGPDEPTDERDSKPLEPDEDLLARIRGA